MTFSLMILLVLGTGCARNRQPKTIPPPPPAQTSAATAPAAPSAEPELRPAAPDPWAGDLDSINRYVEQNGLLGSIFFEFDRYELRAEAREQLSRNAELMRERSQLVFGIEGHCDERGTEEYNLALGSQRAETAKGYLTSLGIGPERLQPVSYGKMRPMCYESTESCWQKNRRVQFKVVGKGGESG